MKRIVETVGESGLESMLGERVVLLCNIYIYAGILSGVNEDEVELKDAKLVYETGPWGDATWKDAQKLPGETWRVRTAHIESWGEGKA